MFSKIERGDWRAKRNQVAQMATYFKMDEKEMLTLWLADKIPVDEDSLINYGSCSHVRKDYFL